MLGSSHNYFLFVLLKKSKSTSSVFIGMEISTGNKQLKSPENDIKDEAQNVKNTIWRGQNLIEPGRKKWP